MTTEERFEKTDISCTLKSVVRPGDGSKTDCPTIQIIRLGNYIQVEARETFWAKEKSLKLERKEEEKWRVVS